jgi:hypothetical protein
MEATTGGLGIEVGADGRLACYMSGPDRYIGDQGALHTWDGRTIGRYRIVNMRRVQSWVATHQIKARFRLNDGRRGIGSGFGNLMLFRGRIK